MVGVPKRAKGCEACRKRRINCDYGRPRCIGCETKDRDCRYPNAFTFVMNEPGSHRTCYQKPKPDRPAITESVDDASKDASEAVAVFEISDKHETSSTTIEVPFPAMGALSIPQRVSNLSAMQQQLLSYALIHFTAQPPTDVALLQTWIPTLQQFATSPSPLKASPLACCAAWIARSDHSSSMTGLSRYLYAEGLREVRTALRVPGAVLGDETLGACLSLAAFEVFECPSQCRATYQWHRRASVNLVRMRGAKMHRDGLGHELFLAVRLHGIFYAYEQRRPNFLCTREWSTVPWGFTPKDDIHRLADILAKGPELIYVADELANKPLEKNLPTLLTLMSRLLDIDADLESFYRDLHSRTTRPLFWETRASGVFTPDDNERGGLSRLAFTNHKTASLLTLYWSIVSMVWSSLEGIYTSLSYVGVLQSLSESPRSARFFELAPRRHWLGPIRDILRSMDYCMGENKGSTGPPGGGLALEIIIDIMRQKPWCEDEYRKAVEARDEMGKRWAAILLSK